MNALRLGFFLWLSFVASEDDVGTFSIQAMAVFRKQAADPITHALGSGDWSEVANMYSDATGTGNSAVLIGDGRGVMWRDDQGRVDQSTTMLIASATKMLSSITFMRLFQAGKMSPEDRPKKYMTWPSSSVDWRSTITLNHLLAFVSGLNTEPDCVAYAQAKDSDKTLKECAQDILIANPLASTTEPGTAFKYSSTHLQVAGAMAEYATGSGWESIFNQYVLKPLGLVPESVKWSIRSVKNPLLAAGVETSVNTYGVILDAVFRNRTFLNAMWLDHMLNDSTRNLTVLASPARDLGYSWDYAQGCWVEVPDSQIFSSMGAFGFYPFIDRGRGYYGVFGTSTLSNLAVVLVSIFVPLIFVCYCCSFWYWRHRRRKKRDREMIALVLQAKELEAETKRLEEAKRAQAAPATELAPPMYVEPTGPDATPPPYAAPASGMPPDYTASSEKPQQGCRVSDPPPA